MFWSTPSSVMQALTQHFFSDHLSMMSGEEFTILQFLYFGRQRDVLSVLPLLNLPFYVYVSVVKTFL